MLAFWWKGCLGPFPFLLNVKLHGVNTYAYHTLEDFDKT